MPINRKRRTAPQDEDYLDEDTITRRSAEEDDDDADERPSRRSRRSREDEEDERPSRRSRRDEDDDEEDERPSRRRSRRSEEDDDDDDADERPSRLSRRSRDEDDEDDEDERPARKSRRSRDDEDDEDDEDERPARKSRRSQADDEDDERPTRKSRRSRDEDDDEDDEDDSGDRSSLIQSGWSAAKKKMAESGSFTNDFRFDEEPQVVKFLSTEPMVYQQHWIERKGKKSFVCLGPKCPLCRVGDEPSVKYAWPVLNFGQESSGDDPVAQLLVCGTKLAKQLEKQDSDKRNGPLDKLFWALSKTGKQQSTSYVLEPVKERDLADDWEIDPDDAAEAVDTVKVPGEDAINITPRDELVDIARDLR